MHKITSKEFTLDDFSYDHLTDEKDGWVRDEKNECYCPALTLLKTIIKTLNAYRCQYLVTKDKEKWWQLIQLLPSSYNQKRTVMMSYEVLANIYNSRKNHKLDEWADRGNGFCTWIRSLPYSELIVGVKENE